MTTQIQPSVERATAHRGSAECKPLINAANKDLFRNNAFRITGLPVDATVRQISKHGDRLKQMEELGMGESAHTAAFALRPPPILDQIREAIQRLQEPEKRFIDEFFWFWPKEFGKSMADPALEALDQGDVQKAFDIWSRREKKDPDDIVAVHNLAVMLHLIALDWEDFAATSQVDESRRQKIEWYWREAFKRWDGFISDGPLWERASQRVREIDDQRLTTGFVRRMRASLPLALDKINAELALDYAENGEEDLATLHIQFMRKSSRGMDSADKAGELVLAPAKARLRAQIQRAKERAQTAPADAANAAHELLEHAGRILFLFDLFFGKGHENRDEVFDEVAALCNQLQVVYYKKTGDDQTCLQILQAILPIACSAELRKTIGDDISFTYQNLALKKLEPVQVLLKEIQESNVHPLAMIQRIQNEVCPFLENLIREYGRASEVVSGFSDSIAIVLRNVSLDAWNKHRDLPTALAANDLAVKHATSPELRQRLAEDTTTLQRMRPMADLTPISSAPSLYTVNGIGCTLYGSTDTDPTTGSYLTTYYFVFLGIPIFPICRYRVTSSGSSYRFLGKAPLRLFDKWHLAISIGLIVFLIIHAGSGPTSSSPSSYTPPAPRAPAYTPVSVAPSAPTYAPPPFLGDGNSGGKVYRVPSWASSTLNNEKAEIESERATLEALKAQMEQLGREIERDRIYLDRTSQFAVDAFNSKVDRYNVLNQQAKIANAAFNAKVNNYNDKLHQYGR